MGSYMVHHQPRGAQRERASISDMRARDARAKRGARARCASKVREQGARVNSRVHLACAPRAPRARTLRTSRAHLARVARARRARTNKLSKSQISSPRAEISSPNPRLVSLFWIWRAYSCARDVRERRARGARARCARCAREVRARDDSRALLAHLARAPVFARASRARVSEMVARLARACLKCSRVSRAHVWNARAHARAWFQLEMHMFKKMTIYIYIYICRALLFCHDCSI